MLIAQLSKKLREPAKLQLRTAKTEDAHAACDIVRRSIGQLCHLDHRNDVETLKEWLANKTPESFGAWFGEHRCLLAEDEVTILGVGMMTHAGEIILNYVVPEARFRGVSKALLDAMESEARKQRLEKVFLSSTKTAHNFYLARGYCDTGSPMAGFGVTVDYPMEKKLPY